MLTGIHRNMLCNIRNIRKPVVTGIHRNMFAYQHDPWKFHVRPNKKGEICI